MIVVTVGTHEQPFDRLVEAAASLAERELLLVQYGTSTVPDGAGGEWIDYMSFDELAERAQAARVFVCHAGVGSIVLARRCGHRPIVVPRRAELGEHVDDHQLELARRLAAGGMVTLVEDADELASVIAGVGSETVADANRALPGKDALTGEVRGFLSELGAARLSRAA
jgi:UDP-N-acetylglucosamine transferase subunit ALG13